MLIRQDGATFSIGRSRFADRAEDSQEQAAKILVKIAPESLDVVLLAQMDTGAPWSILDAEVAEALALLNGDGEPKRLSTRIGDFNGRLERTRIDIVADEGDSLSVDATVWVSPDWPGSTFLGYGGLLERIRFAIDPGDSSFYFGPIE